MKSMTGFGSATAATRELELDVNVRSVNGRFLEIRVHGPREYLGFEPEIKKTVSQTIARGTVDIYLNRRPGPQAEAADVVVRTALAKKWLAGYKELAKALKLRSAPTLELISRVPDVIKIEENHQVGPEEKAQVLRLVAEAVRACDVERVREGKSLAKELERLMGLLEGLTLQMEELRSGANQELERKYRERLQKLGFEGQVDPQRLAQEVVMQLDRADIAEEISRLKEHVRVYHQLLKTAEPQGKKMDFYAQELLREVNTIGSKSHLAKLTAMVVDAKTLVERIREQVQNVE